MYTCMNTFTHISLSLYIYIYIERESHTMSASQKERGATEWSHACVTHCANTVNNATFPEIHVFLLSKLPLSYIVY